MFLQNERDPRIWANEVLAGLTVSLAMVPEVIAFAFVAGVNPLVGLYAAFAAGLAASLFGGRPGMITGGAGSLAVVSTALVAAHGVDYLFAAVAVMGLIQISVGLLRWGRFIRMVPHPVMLGFVNGLAAVIFLAQLRHFHGLRGLGLIEMLGLVALTVGLTGWLPRLTRAVPASLGAIILVTLLVHGLRLPVHTVGDLASIHGGWPRVHWPAVPLTWETLRTVLPFSIVLAGVGLTESLLTQTLLDEMTETQTSHNQECIGQGLGNVAAALTGGMGGCAMIAQSILNIEAGGRRRISGVVEALCILSFIVFASRLIALIPMAALVGVMFVVVSKTFAWTSLRILHKIPRGDAAVLVLVSVVTVTTNLAAAVMVGVIASALMFAWQSGARLDVRRREEDGRVVYEIQGPLFFGSVRNFRDGLHPAADSEETTLDFQFSALHDHSALEAVQAMTTRYRSLGKTLLLRGLSPRCQQVLHNAGVSIDIQGREETARQIADTKNSAKTSAKTSAGGN